MILTGTLARYGNLRQFMAPYGILWQLMATYGNLLLSSGATYISDAVFGIHRNVSYYLPSSKLIYLLAP